MLEKKKLNFDSCKFFCMDEADRMVDLGFEDDVRNIMSYFKVLSLCPASAIASLMGHNSVNDKHYFSPPRCRERSKTLPSNRLFDLCLLTSAERVQPTWMSCRLSNMSN